MDCEDRSEKQLLWNMDGAGNTRFLGEVLRADLSRRKIKMVRTRHSFVCCVMAAMSSSIELEKRSGVTARVRGVVPKGDYVGSYQGQWIDDVREMKSYRAKRKDMDAVENF